MESLQRERTDKGEIVRILKAGLGSKHCISMFSCTSNEFDVLVREKLKFFTSLGCPVNGMWHVQLLILFNSSHERVETDGDLKTFFPRHVNTNLYFFLHNMTVFLVQEISK